MPDRESTESRPERRAAATWIALLAAFAVAQAGPAQTRSYSERPDDPPAPTAARDDLGARTPGGRIEAGSYVSIQVNVDSEGRNIVGDAANEPSIAVSPVDPLSMVVGWRQFDSVGSNFRQGGWAWSADGGQSWTFPGVLEPGVFRSDPVLDVDSAGRFFYNSLKVDFSMDFWRSIDGGVSWLSPVPAFGGDKNWAAIDRTGGVGEGNVYGVWQRGIGCCGPDIFTRSTDGGTSFASPVDVDLDPSFGVIAVGPDGEVYATGVETAPFQDFDTFIVSRSDDARDPFAQPTFVGRRVDLGGSMVLGASPIPDGLLGQAWVAVDRSQGPSRGHVYLLGSVNPPGSDPLDVKIARSVDGGLSWEPPVRVNQDAGTAWQWFGTLSVAPNGRLDVVWNDTRASGISTVSQLFYSWSYDGGKTWSPDEAVSTAFDSTLGWPNQNKLGDYYDMVSDSAGADLAWAATFNGEQDVYYLRLFPDCNDNGVSDVTDILGGASPDDNGNEIPDECDGLVLEDPDPGVAGGSNTFRITGATAGETVVLLAALDAGETAVPGCPGVGVNVASPRLLGSAVADGSGTAIVTATIPGGAAGMTILTQAVDRTACARSNLGTYRYE